MTWLVNPAEDDEEAELAFGKVFEEEEVDFKLTTTNRKSPAAARRNPSASLGVVIGVIMPVAVGGGLGIMDALNPRWWARIAFPTRAFLLVGVAVVARKRGELAVYGAALALAGRYMALWATMKAKAAKDAKPAANSADAADQGALPVDQIDRELAAAADELAHERPAGFTTSGFGEIPVDEVRSATNDILIAAAAAA